MKKIVLIIMALAMLLSFASCTQTDKPGLPNGSGDETSKPGTAEETKPTYSDVATADIEAAIKKAIGEDGYFCDTDISGEFLASWFGFDMSCVEEYTAKENSIGAVNPDNVVILKVKDGYADTAVAKLNEAFARKVSYVRIYPFGTAKVLNARIYSIGNYVIFVLAGARYDGEDGNAEIKLAMEEYKKVDAALESIFGKLPKNSAVVPEDNGNNGGAFVPGDNDGGIFIGG
ncbi:MAG: DUF4358 domain-containing protein [Eubacteriales bacterium]